MYPLNAWYVACTPQEIDDKPLGRRICQQPIVFYRARDGAVTALEDFCPHRGAPLSLGQVIEGRLVCGYHGHTHGQPGQTEQQADQRWLGDPPQPCGGSRRAPAFRDDRQNGPAAGHVHHGQTWQRHVT